jgi:hypothetical protein
MLKRLNLLIPVLLLITGCGASTESQTCPSDVTSYYDINDFIHYGDINGIMKMAFNEYNSYFDNDFQRLRGWYSIIEDTLRLHAIEFYFYRDPSLVDRDDIYFITYPLLIEDTAYGYKQEILTKSILGLEASTRLTYYGVPGYETLYYYEISLIKDNRLYYIQLSDSDDWTISTADQDHLIELLTLFIRRIEACRSKLG